MNYNNNNNNNNNNNILNYYNNNTFNSQLYIKNKKNTHNVFLLSLDYNFILTLLSLYF